ncbi:MAG: ABC transporter ATP-binding protein [Candidatus Andersenbacteria bacterium]|nr:ABC transporter ATP-binding protein [Candidatus Andersenbacteria bacterium]
MSPETPIIEVQELGKKYTISGKREMYRTLSGQLLAWLSWRGRAAHTVDFWALKDVNFTVKRGEVLGVVGRNGAGKSTLLKILSRITDPSEGQVIMRGRVASLLEVGTGFHPELTGRENIYLSGAVLGMSGAEITRKFDEIVAFAEIEKFLDTPIKRFSSGMYMRLAFSVAAHLDPEILLVDEVLAVGDAAFQKKCLGKMDAVAQSGRTVLFVSHQLEFLAQLCKRCILVDGGRVVMDGEARDVIDHYVHLVKTSTPLKLRQRSDRQGEGHITFTETWVEDMAGRRVRRLTGGQMVKIVATYEAAPGFIVRNMGVSFAVMTVRGVVVVDLGTDATGGGGFFGDLPARGRIECIIPKLSLNSGDFVYNVLARSAKSGSEVEDWVKQAGVFSVEPGDYYSTGHIPGSANLVCMDHSWKIKPI